jgi:NADPH2:quinone reductase
MMTSGIPDSMTAVEITAPGGPDVLVPAMRPTPSPATGEVLIRVVGAGLNGADLKQRRGVYPMPAGAPDIPGLEVSGEVVAVGNGVRSPAIGEFVCALISGGGYAEYALAPAPQCLPIPANVELVAAAGLPETYCTVWTNVFERGRLSAGETFLVHGGSSGIGVTAIQLAKAFGATVLTTAGNEEKCQACRELGADHAINYRLESFKEVALDVTNNAGVDLILDMIGGDYIAPELELLRHEGRLVFVALGGGRVAQADFGLIHAKHLTVTGARLRPRSVAEKGMICEALKEKAWPLFRTRQIQPVVDAVFPLKHAAEAHRYMETGKHIGKILLSAGISGTI